MTKFYASLPKDYRRIYDKIKKEKDTILQGRMVSVDPSSNSCGIAVWLNGEFKEGYTIAASRSTLPVAVRLSQIFNKLPQLGKVDIIFVEKVRTSTGHVFLTWSVGMLLTFFKSPKVIEIPTNFWKKVIDKDWYKSDCKDAEYIGKLVMRIINDADS